MSVSYTHLDDYMNEDTLMQGDDSFFDYCAEIDDDERQYHIDNLVTVSYTHLNRSS